MFCSVRCKRRSPPQLKHAPQALLVESPPISPDPNVSPCEIRTPATTISLHYRRRRENYGAGQERCGASPPPSRVVGKRQSAGRSNGRRHEAAALILLRIGE